MQDPLTFVYERRNEEENNFLIRFVHAMKSSNETITTECILGLFLYF